LIKVVIVDDTRLFREGIKNILDESTDIEVTGLAENGREALKLCEKLLPDVVLMDIVMPVMDGIEGTKKIKEQFNSIKILMLTTSSDDDKIIRAMAEGADGYILKDITSDELILSIKSVVTGKLNIIDGNIYQRVMEHITSVNDMEKEKASLDEYNFTDKEMSILKLVAKGYRNREIAESLFIAEGRVKNIITGLLQKLELKDRTQLAVFSVKKGLI
jgi:DNA-binding NarL/FixJ family response regulator